MKNLVDLTGKTILVTGASSGIGRQTAITLSEVGARVVLTARREEQLQETLGMLAGNGHAYYPYDICKMEDMEEFLKEILVHNGKLQGLAYCAGIVDVRPCRLTTPEAMNRIMTTNFFAFFELVRQFAKKKYSDEGAKIVAVSSMASTCPGKGLGAYAASKAAIDASVLVLAQELMFRHININTVHPATVNSPMVMELQEENRKVILDKQPLGYISTCDVAMMNAYLLSSAADMITGQKFDINGGYMGYE